MRYYKFPKWLKRFYPGAVWDFFLSDTSQKTIFLTFDDGPNPDSTDWILNLLDEHDAKATFFCIGDNVAKNPEIFHQILREKHAIGNHTMHHINGHKSTFHEYLSNIELCNSEFKIQNSELFRPPYGKLTSPQAKALRKLGYHIIMWDVLSADFDPSISEEKCLQNVLKHIKPGSIVVFHDSLKAEKNLRYTLPKVMEFIKNKGWECASITENDIEQLKNN